MPRHLPTEPPRISAPALALAAALGALSCSHAFAQQGQQVPGLRGQFDVAGQEQDAATEPVDTPPTYDPVSPGALAAEESADTFGPIADETVLFGEDASDPLPAPRPARPLADTTAPTDPDPTTAASRASRQQPAGQALAGEALAEPDPATTGATRAERSQPVGPVQDGTFGPVEPIEDRRIAAQDDPFAPVGIRVGSFILRPTLEQGLAYSTNIELSPEARSGVLSETTLRLNAVSDWSRHSATIDGYGTYRRALSGTDYDDARGGVDAIFTYDITEEMRAIATAGYLRTPETASSPVVVEGTISEPWLQTITGSLGLEKDMGKARFAITGRLEHDDYSDADLEDGTVLSQEDRNSTLATVVLRAGYEIAPSLVPFLEGELGRRKYQIEEDAAGYRRSSNRYGFRGGFELDLNEKLVGEFSAGYIREEFVDERLAPIEGPSVAAALRWSPERETTVALTALTTVEGATGDDQSGSILQTGRIAVERQLRSNLSGTAAVGLGWRDYSGTSDHDLLLDAEISATWWFNRHTGITGRLRHERLDSNLDDRDYDANSVFLGLRLQR
jgi:hypothetical protein